MLLEIFLLYAFVSGVLFVFPQLLHKRKSPSNNIEREALSGKKVLCIAHRGGSRENLENTLTAFRHAVALGANMLEMDVCLTKDKKIVVIHDRNLERMCGIEDSVANYNYADLPKMRPVVNLDFSVDGTVETASCKTCYFPLLEDVFKEFPNTLINIELKTPTDEFLRLTNDLIVKYKREYMTIWGCRPLDFNKRALAVNPKIKRWMNEKSCFTIYGTFFIGLLPFISIDEDSMQVPQYTRDFKNWKLKQWRKPKQQLIVRITFFLMWLINRTHFLLFWHLRKRGISAYLWVPNTIEEFEDSLGQGATGIMTDSPTLLKKYLVAKNKFIDDKLVITV